MPILALCFWDKLCVCGTVYDIDILLGKLNHICFVKGID